MNGLTDQELEEIAQAMDLAVRHIAAHHVNTMTATALRYIDLERRARGILERRRQIAEREEGAE